MAERRKPKPEAPFPRKIQPMLSVPTDKRPSDPQHWLCEFKWNGVRAIVYIKNSQEVRITSEQGKDITGQYQDLANRLSLLARKFSLVSDGEIVGSGIARRYKPFQFVATDLLYLDGEDLTSLPLVKRKSKLGDKFSNLNLLGIYPNLFVEGDYEHIIKVAEKDGFPGVVFKRLRSVYVPRSKSRNWRHMNFERS